MPGPRAARSPSRINKRLTPSGGGGRWAYEHKNEEAIEMLQAAGVNEDAKDRGSRPSRPAHCAAAALPPPRRASAYRRHHFLPFRAVLTPASWPSAEHSRAAPRQMAARQPRWARRPRAS